MLRILVTNDDGINFIGIKKLAEGLRELGDVTVVAPDRERSATGHAITIHHPLRIEKVNGYPTDVCAWSVDGTPSDCVKIALQSIMKEAPDVVISGINNGANLGTDVIYSGTVSAAIEGAIHGIPSIAISVVGNRNEIKFDGATAYIPDIVDALLKSDNKASILNVNVPSISKDEIRGFKITELGFRKYSNSYIKREDPAGRMYYWLSGELVEIENNISSDVKAIENNYISITPLHFDLTDYKCMESMKQWDLFNR